MRVYTNGRYSVLGFVFRKTLYGICVGTLDDVVYRRGQIVVSPEYHLPTDKKPQWVPRDA